jgi:RimJ/RimL family protein N-acetyltransferase
MKETRPLPQVVLRQWRESDRLPFAEMNADPKVMRFFPRPLTAEESAAAQDKYFAAITERGWNHWAVEVEGKFAGLTGLAEATFPAPFTPCIEIGWRFRPEYWGRGIAYAAARQAEAYAFRELRLPELFTFTAVLNLPSQRLMERLGFRRDLKGDFLHPRVPEGHPIRPHVLYRKRAEEYSLSLIRSEIDF